MQVYRYFDIGSGKLPVDKRMGVPHHLIDVVDPDYHFDASSFCERSVRAVDEITRRGRIPMFVGGTGLYIESFFKGLSPVPDIDTAIREVLNNELAVKGAPCMHQELSSVDPESAARIHPNDSQRILRALQVYRGTGRTLSEFRNRRVPRESEKTLFIGIGCEREELDSRIEKRVDGMMKCGFLDEVISLVQKGYTPVYNSMKSIGYRELYDYLDGKCPLDESVLRIKRETREYARKQTAWFRREKLMRWFDYRDIDGIFEAVSAWLADGDRVDDVSPSAVE